MQSVPRLLPKLFKCAIAFALLGVVSACEEPPEFKHNPVDVLKMNTLQRSWFVDLQFKGESAVRIDVRDKLVYVYTDKKHVVAYDRNAGTPVMDIHVNSPDVELKPLVELKDRIVFPSATSLEVYDKDGLFERSIPLEHPLRGNAAGEDELVFFGSAGQNGGLVECYDVSAPYAVQRWEYLTHDAADVTAGVAVNSGVVYSGSEKGEIDAVTIERTQIWDTDHGNFLVYGPIFADMKADDSGLYVACRDYSLYCINKTTGKLKWQYFAGVPLLDSPVLSSDTIYQFVPGKGLAALDKGTGGFDRTPRWVHEIDPKFPQPTQFLAQDERYTYLAEPHSDRGDTVYTILAVDKQTGKTAFRSDHKDFQVVGSNRGKDATIYAGYRDGKLFAIKPVLKAGQIGELVMVPADQCLTAAGL